MLTFTENMSRIEYLTAWTLVHVQEENYQKTREDLDNIHVHTVIMRSGYRIESEVT